MSKNEYINIKLSSLRKNKTILDFEEEKNKITINVNYANKNNDFLQLFIVNLVNGEKVITDLGFLCDDLIDANRENDINNIQNYLNILRFDGRSIFQYLPEADIYECIIEYISLVKQMNL